MKKILAFTLAFVLTLPLVACSTTKAPTQAGPAFTIENGAYQCTPDEFVLALRQMINNVEGVNFTPREIPLPSEKGADGIGHYTYAIIPKQLIIDIGTDNYGNVDNVQLNWIYTTEANNNATLIAFALVHMLMPTDADETYKDFNLAITDDVSFRNDSDGTNFFFYGSKSSKLYLWISPSISGNSQESGAVDE